MMMSSLVLTVVARGSCEYGIGTMVAAGALRARARFSEIKRAVFIGKRVIGLIALNWDYCGVRHQDVARLVRLDAAGFVDLDHDQRPGGAKHERAGLTLDV